MSSADDGLDLDRILSEIREEVAERRASGDFPPSLERELDLAFDQYVPIGTTSSDFREAIGAADRAAYINVAVPTESQKPGVGEVKRVLRKAMAWYLNYLAQQTTSFATASVRAMRALGERLAVLEEQLQEWQPEIDDSRDRPGAAPDLTPWVAAAVRWFQASSGRVLHAECGDGLIVRSLLDAGVDAYGVDPRGALVDLAVQKRIEAWPDEPVAHLGSVADGFLGGLILSGCVDRLPLGRQRRLLQLAEMKLSPGAPLLLICSRPESWDQTAPALERDLAPGRPLHASTWAHLLGRLRFTGIEIIEDITPTTVGISARR